MWVSRERVLPDAEPYMLISLDTLVAIGAIVVVGMYLVAQTLTGVNLARDRAAIEHLIAYRPSTTDRVLHTEWRVSP